MAAILASVLKKVNTKNLADLTLLHSERPKLFTILAFVSAIWLWVHIFQIQEKLSQGLAGEQKKQLETLMSDMDKNYQEKVTEMHEKHVVSII